MSKDIAFVAKQKLSVFLPKNLNRYTVQAGVLEDKPAAKPAEGTTRRPMGEVRKRKGQAQGVSLRDLMAKFNTSYNILLAPWRNPNNKEVAQVVDDIAKDLNHKGRWLARIKAGVQAVIRNPIKRKEYGSNTQATQKRKGFDWLFVQTGKLFENIKVEFLNRV